MAKYRQAAKPLNVMINSEDPNKKDKKMPEISKWTLECKFADSTYYHTQKVGNPAKQNQLNNSCLTDPSQMFKDGMISALPIPHECAFHMFLLQSPSNDFKIIILVYAFSPSSASDSNKNFFTQGLYSSKVVSNNFRSY